MNLGGIKITQITVFFFIILVVFSCKTEKHQTLLFVGSFTDKTPGEGIHLYEFNNETGEVVLKFTLESVTNTSFLKLSPNGKYLYSVVESQMDYHGKVASFQVDSINYKLKLLNKQDCGGRNPVHIEIDKTGEYLVNSNYTDPSLSVFKINKDGSLNTYSQVLRFNDSSVVKSRQESAHIHSSNFSPDNKFLFAQDLGADKTRAFDFVTKQEDSILLNENQIKVKLGSGPRHFTFHPNGKYGYGVAELSGRITAYKYENGNLTFVQDYLAYQQKQDIYRAADIHISSDGNFLYASNRGPEEDSIAIFSINENTGELKLMGHENTHGEHPRNFAISPNGRFLLVANQFSDNLVVFRRDIETGKLTRLLYSISVDNPSSIQMRTYLGYK
tara:strand:- start:693 stop:1853 length:1161 start_codon:yes stop_codon:yes gene_type:complete